MRLSKLLVIAVASSSMIAAPVMANPAASLSVANSSAMKASSSGKNASNLEGTSFVVVGILGLAAFIGGIWAVADGGDSDSN